MSNKISKKISFELVTSTNKKVFDELHDSSHQEADELYFHHNGWYSSNDSKDSWNTEQHIIFSDKKPIGFFGITKYYLNFNAYITGFYIDPAYRGKSIPKHIVLFIGNRVFGELGYNKIETSAWSGNTKVVELYDSILNREGEIKEKYYYKRKFYSEILWGVTYKNSIWNGVTTLTLKEMDKKLKG